MVKRSYGFTMIELLVTVAVLGVLAAVAFPNMREYLDKQRLVTQMRAISSLAQFARSEAIKHSGNTNFKSVAMTVSPAAPWYVGLANGTAACTDAATCVINEGGASVSHMVNATDCSNCATMTSPGGQAVVVFDMRGLVTTGADQAITLQSPLGKQLSLSVSRIGRISLCSPGGSVIGYAAC